MATQALYRIWRPRTFTDVSGQDAAVTTLKNQVASGRISHAYLFCGSRGTGKTTTAKIFANAVNCTSPVGGDPCGACDACRALSSDNSLDIIEIDAASNNGVDEIRDLRDKIKYPPQHGRYRVYIIDEVHMLSTGAFNALLKTLEEPPEHALFILATTEPQRLPATVLSRVQRYDFRRIPAPVIVDRLRQIASGEHAEASDEALMLIARSAEGGFRDAINLLDMSIAYGGGSVDAALVRELLGATDKAFLFTFCGHLIDGDAAGAMQAIDTLMRAGREVQVFARDVTGHLRALLLAQTGAEGIADLLDTTGEDAAQYAAQAKKISRERLLLLLDLFLDAETNMRWSAQPRTALEVAGVRACLPEETLRLDALASRLDLLEKRMERGAVAPPPKAPRQTETPSQSLKEKAVNAPPSEEPPMEEEQVWARAKAILRKEPQLLAPIMRGQFAGIQGDVVHLRFPREEAIYCNMFNQEARKERVEAMLSEAAGRPMKLAAQLEPEKPTVKPEAKNTREHVFEVFGRENVQVVDDGEST